MTQNKFAEIEYLTRGFPFRRLLQKSAVKFQKKSIDTDTFPLSTGGILFGKLVNPLSKIWFLLRFQVKTDFEYQNHNYFFLFLVRPEPYSRIVQPLHSNH